MKPRVPRVYRVSHRMLKLLASRPSARTAYFLTYVISRRFRRAEVQEVGRNTILGNCVFPRYTRFTLTGNPYLSEPSSAQAAILAELQHPGQYHAVECGGCRLFPLSARPVRRQPLENAER